MPTRKIIKSVLFLAAYVSLMVWLAACQQPESEVELPEPEDAFAKADMLGQYINNITLLDGSVDNIIDNTSCLKVVYPLEVTVSGASQILQSDDDLEELEELYQSNPYREFIEINYPFTALRADYTELTIESKEELQLLSSACQEGGADSDIECVDFDYPIVVSTYDITNQSANTREVRNDQSLHNVLGGLSEEDLITLDFPVSLLTAELNYTVNDHVELQDVIEMERNSCDETDHKFYTDQELSFGTIQLFITDAPFPIEFIAEANVTITQINLKTGSENDSISFLTLFDETVSYNLLELTNGLTEELANKEIPAGDYEFFNILVEGGEVVLTDGRTFDLKVPSGNTSGIKVKPDHPISVTANTTNSFLFDFDLSRSFIAKGNPNDISKINGFNFKPVIKVSNTEMTGILEGEVTDEEENTLEGVQITVLAADTVNTTAFTASDGSYKVLGLTPGSYELEAELEDFDVFQAEDILIEQGETTILNIELE